MKYKFIIFDFDGTLADTIPYFISNINKIADKYEFKRVTEEKWKIIRGHNADKLFKYLNVPSWKISMIENDLKTLITDDIHQISLFQGIDTLLKCLSDNGITLAIVTTNTYENVYQVLGSESAILIKYYECDVSIFEKKIKLIKVLSNSGFLNAESIYIGDEIRDSEAAKKANIAFGGVSWGYNSIDSLKVNSPKEIFTNINEIIEKLLSSH
jgi:phosphoglycolate phosphatase